MFEVTIVGGGVMGAATACFLARDHGATVTVVEREPSYARASSSLSLSSIRQQFSQPVNIALSRWSLGFLRRVADELAVADERPAIGLVEPGYLYLATEAGAPTLRELHACQRAEGVDVVLLAPAELAARFPWLAVDDLALGSLGLSGEGWFDGPALHRAFRRKAQACGARFVTAEATGFDTAGERVTAVRCADGSRIEGDAVVITAGAWSAPLGRALGVELPVHAKKRDVFVLETPAALPGCPLVIDPSGFWFRTEGALILAGGPPRSEDADELPLDAIDHGLFDALLWPTLAARVPALEALRLRSAWAGYYEMNAFDHNGLAGRLPGYANAFTACGFSGHGMQQAPAVGWAMARLIAGQDAPLIDALAPQRLRDGKPLLEANVI
ncbi:NAD(P)/FAD-dependent oxidoreductase [Roseateles saccharophilus]|uniref:Glycine/D-amino acid oxidase-like deaminating enzyme n=1 Tax=Roseateles saccharophilus TaxID=304 RepID=A0A4R3VK24_ROSSA|nr:FAD-binding oxidoreductase [Roseateles saccharophilus]MDG0832872.1 FAD-binding oxidoreductase [Roseateles saccharophilus]TCV04543.1 glycine/D-amino acid oxidase-like deaminating enzyme [Roseateles saccharophilus]